MLDLDSPEVKNNLFGRPDKFAYPVSYKLDDLREDMGLFAQRDYSRNNEPFAPTDALEFWYKSLPGQHQSNQTSRYDAYHGKLVLPAELGIDENSPESIEARLEVLKYLARYIGSDLHPLGHMALTLGITSDLLYNSRFNPYTNLRALRLASHGAAIHDAAETIHPGVIISTGGAVGDIRAGEKTREDKKIEKQILTELLNKLYKDVYPPDFIADLVNFVRHDIDQFDEDTKRYHELGEIAHNLVARQSADAAFRGAGEDPDMPFWTRDILINLANDVRRNITPKLLRSLETVPELRPRVEFELGVLSRSVTSVHLGDVD